MARAVAAIRVRRALLDGEFVVFGHDGRSDFELLRARVLRWRFGNTDVPATVCFF